jgi:surface protein
MSWMFAGCRSLESLPNISKWDTSNVINMSWMFAGCRSLNLLPDISKWDISKVNYINGMFAECRSLSSLPDISNWNNDIEDMSLNTHSLLDRSEISILEFNNTDINEEKLNNSENKFLVGNSNDDYFINSNVLSDLSCQYDIKSITLNLSISDEKRQNKSELFYQESTLKEQPNRQYSYIYDISHLFSGCKKLKSVPDISRWKISCVEDISFLFSRCESLESLPDLSQWNTMNVTNMDSIFYGCKSLVLLPDISKWNTMNVTNMNSIFYGCSSLKTLPDISKWNTNNVKNMKNMFQGCESLISLPDIPK